MSEYRRNETHQFCDTELVMVLDTVTGKPERFGEGRDSVGNLSDALDYLERKKGWESRTIIVNMQCIQGFKIK